MAKTIAVIGALDTKSDEFLFVKEDIEKRGHAALVINVGIVQDPGFNPDISADQVARAGGSDLVSLREKSDRGLAIDTMAKGIAKLIVDLHTDNRIQAVISMGGSAGTEIGTAAMRALPLGVPKVMVSTLASGDTKPYVGTRDIVMVPSIVDVAGINRISVQAYANAVGAVIGMVETPAPAIEEKPLLAASMFGNTTPVVNRCRSILEENGYEVLIFHQTGTPEILESLVADGYITGVLDITTTEWADQIAGGVLPGGLNRYDVVSQKGIPQIVAPGCIDMANFWARETVPKQYDNRRFFQWAPNVTLMRTTPEENAAIGRILAEKATQSSGPVAFFLPLKGVSMLDAPEKEFWWPEANRALFDAIKDNLKPGMPVYEMDCNINDEEFAVAMANKMLEFLE
ncbi:MAG: Tm-1-like ATP-binding domain-containing protein [Deltaproteobacteria bacterium]|nr:Tm-1-like ATP-binding domain-containing protein [Deltaproteobacteria bacterium]